MACEKRQSGAIYKSPRLPGLCAGGGATGGRAVEPRSADYAYDVDAAPEARRARRRRRRRDNTLASPRRIVRGQPLSVGATVEKPVKWTQKRSETSSHCNAAGSSGQKGEEWQNVLHHTRKLRTAAACLCGAGLPRVLSGTRAALEIPAAAYPTTRYRAPLPDAAHAIAAEAI